MRCFKCDIELNEYNQYSDKKGNYPLKLCKHCSVIDINLDDPYKTPTIFESLDIPIILDVWSSCCAKYETKIAIFGKYLAKMKLKGFQPFGFDDTLFFQNYISPQTIDIVEQPAFEGVIGGVWGATYQAAANKLKEIVSDYKIMGISTTYSSFGDNYAKVKFSNGDEWFAVALVGSIKGRRINISYIDNRISNELVTDIINPITTRKPYQAIYSYFGKED